MNPNEKLSENCPAEDRAALRNELLGAAGGDRLRVFDALNREADPDEEVPQMPEGLRDQLVEQFGDRAPRRAAAAPPAPGFFEKLVAVFQAKPLVAYGGLAAAACAAVLMMIQLGGGAGDGSDRRVDQLRGDGHGHPAATADVPVYLFPQARAAEVLAMMAEGRKVIVCEDAADFEKRLDAKWAVAVDLDRRVLVTIEDGTAGVEKPIGGDGARSVLLGIRAALDGMTNF